MEPITLEKDIQVFYKTASSFPDGVMEAHQNIHAITPRDDDRSFFGISRPEGSMSNIVYRAAAEEMSDGEAVALGLDTLTLKSGTYISIAIHDFMKDLPAIGNAFQQLLQDPRIDAQGYCVEWYYNDTDVRCMIRLAD